VTTPPETSLADRVAAAARTVRLRPGHNSLAIIKAGGTIALSGSEADEVAAAILPLVQAELDAARAERDAFADRVDTLTAVAMSNKRHVQEMYTDLLKAQAATEQARTENDRLRQQLAERTQHLVNVDHDRERALAAAAEARNAALTEAAAIASTVIGPLWHLDTLHEIRAQLLAGRTAT
jgi:chromosome segregation ATPase